MPPSIKVWVDRKRAARNEAAIAVQYRDGLIDYYRKIKGNGWAMLQADDHNTKPYVWLEVSDNAILYTSRV